MADDGEPLNLDRQVVPSRFWFVAPGEPRDFKTFCDLSAKALTEAREELLTHSRAAHLLAVIGKYGREGHIRSLEGEVSAIVSKYLSKPETRQPVKGAYVVCHCVPLPKAGRIESIVLIRAWSHCYRTSFSPILGK